MCCRDFIAKISPRRNNRINKKRGGGEGVYVIRNFEVIRRRTHGMLIRVDLYR